LKGKTEVLLVNTGHYSLQQTQESYNQCPQGRNILSIQRAHTHTHTHTPLQWFTARLKALCGLFGSATTQLCVQQQFTEKLSVSNTLTFNQFNYKMLIQEPMN